jgi:hypothetical protein
MSTSDSNTESGTVHKRGPEDSAPEAYAQIVEDQSTQVAATVSDLAAEIAAGHDEPETLADARAAVEELGDLLAALD